MSQTQELTPRKLPIGVQSFRQLRGEGYVYVDKTDLIWRMAHGPASQFIARPRRFGKSLMISTLKSYFEGEGQLFEGLKIERLRAEAGETEWVKHPTFFFGFSASSFSGRDDVHNVLDRWLTAYEGEYGIAPAGGIGERTAKLLSVSYQQTGIKPVILVDEYDNPLTDTIAPHLKELHQHFKAQLRGFYKAIKESGEIIHRTIITGITQFTELSLFSGVNSIMNESLNPAYAALCGITEEELIREFQPEIEEIATRENIDFEGAVSILRDYYDGYRFTSSPLHVYNPQSLLFCFYQKQLSNTWSETGMPALLATVFPTYTFDLELLTEPIPLDAIEMHQLDFSGQNPVPLLFQSGYLTIKDYETESYTLRFPNREVESSFWKVLLKIFNPSIAPLHPARSGKFMQELKNQHIERAMGELLALIAGIPYSAVGQQQTQSIDLLPSEQKRQQTKTRIYEQLFQVALYAWFTALGCRVRTEEHSLHGRSDIVLELPAAIYIFELKVGPGRETGQTALAQIKERRYAEPHRAKNKPIYGIGAAFDLREETRGDCDWTYEKL